MRFIGNIVTDSKIEDVELFNVVKDINDIIDGIPTLIIGWEKVNKYFDGVKILEWEVKPNIYWTFGKRERRNQLERDMVRFKKLAMNKLSKKVKYTFLNILTANKDIKTRLFNSLMDSSAKTVYILNNLLYCCYSESGKVVGISLRDIEYGGGDVKKIFSVLYSNKSVKMIKDKEDVPFEVKNPLKNNLYVIPYIYT